MDVLLLTSDLTVVSSVEGAAKMWGKTVQSFATTQAILTSDLEGAKLLIVDLGAPSLDLKELVETLQQREEPPRIIAFGPHVHEERLAAAREAGCDQVMSRGQFFAQLKSILGE